jgi:carbamoylphosphate synthase small subunit
MARSKTNLKKLLKIAKELNYDVKALHNNHIKVTGNNHVFTVAGTPKKDKVLLAITNQIFRLGLNKGNDSNKEVKWHP